MSGFNSHQLRAVPAAGGLPAIKIVVATQRDWSYRLRKNVLLIRSEIHHGYIMNVSQFDLQSLYGCTTQLILQTGNSQVCTIFHILGDQ